MKKEKKKGFTSILTSWRERDSESVESDFLANSKKNDSNSNVTRFTRLKSESGAALVWVLIVMMVMSFAFASIAMIQKADIKEVASLENQMTAYYAAIGGTELAIGALMSDYGSSSKSLFEQYVKANGAIPGASGGKLSHTYTYVDSAASKDIASVDIEVSIVDGWVLIESKGTDLASNVVCYDYTRISKDNKHEIYRDGKERFK